LRLAREFRRPDVDAFLSEMTAAQFAEWESLYAIEESGPLRDDLRAAKIVAAIYNCAFGRGKDTPTVKPEDVFDSLAPDPLAEQTPAEMRAAMGLNRKRPKKGR
jgi:hypothetical protein